MRRRPDGRATSRPAGTVVEEAADPAGRTAGQVLREQTVQVPKNRAKMAACYRDLLLIICCVFGGIYLSRMLKTK